MPTKPLLPGWKSLGGKSRNFVNEKTGEVLSRRKFEELRGIYFEKKAAENRAKDELEQLARPARGRKSVVKAAPEFKQSVTQARKEKRVQVEEEEKATKEMAKRVRTVERKANKKVHVKKIRDQLLKPGRLGARIPFNDYSDYLDLYKQIQTMGKKIFAYGLGITFVVSEERENFGEEVHVTVFTMMAARDKVSKNEFESRMKAAKEEASYLRFKNYWMQIKFGNQFAQEKAAKAGIKRNFNLR